MFTSCINTIRHITTIWENEKSWKEKTEIFGAFLVVSTNLILNNFRQHKKQHQQLLGCTIHFFNYSVFFWLFYEIFIQKDYIFKARNPSIIDCGSNIGMSILFFKRIFPNAKIIGFEPDKETFSLLKKNIDQNNLSNVTVHNIALAKKEGTSTFYSDADTKGNLAMSITKSKQGLNLIKKSKVTTAKLSSYVTKNVDFLKMDIEGAELQVLEDLDETKKIHYVKEMVIEYHYSNNNPTNRLGSILALLEKNNFICRMKADISTPFYENQRKPYNALVYAYRNGAFH